MAEQLITPENLSKELLKNILDAAFMDTSFDKDGDLVVRDRLNCYVFPSRERVQLMALFRFTPDSTEDQRLAAANRINMEYAIIRAMVGKSGALLFTWDIPVAGGITAKAFVLAVKRFCTIPQQAIAECASDLVA